MLRHQIPRVADEVAGALTVASLLAIAGFTVLGSVFSYPQILEEPTAVILQTFREHQGTAVTWFLVLGLSAALLAPAGILLGRMAGGRVGRWIAGTGIAAAVVVQAVGLSRWALFVPGLSGDATDPARRPEAERTFELLHTWLGQALGETVGYALTATFTVLVAYAVTTRVAPRWMTWARYAAAALIATGVVVPLGVAAASLTNVSGYVIWCLWLVAMGVALWRTPDHAPEPALAGL